MGKCLLTFGAWKGLQPMITLDSGRALAERALGLFDATLEAHGLASALRPSLALAAVCYAAAECFAEVIGEPTERLLAPLAILQETLGALQDEVTARAYLAALHLTDDPGAQAYLAHRKAACAPQLAALPDHWAQVVGANYRSRFLVVLAAL